MGGFDDCEELTACKCLGACICCEEGCDLECFGCMEQENRTCLNQHQTTKCCDCTSEKSIFCYEGCDGICFCCCVGKQFQEIGFPKTCVKENVQCACVHFRTAIPCDEEVPCALACCGIYCYGQAA